MIPGGTTLLLAFAGAFIMGVQQAIQQGGFPSSASGWGMILSGAAVGALSHMIPTAADSNNAAIVAMVAPAEATKTVPHLGKVS
jgi:hypothetical protein